MEGYSPPFRHDRHSHGGGILLFYQRRYSYKDTQTKIYDNFLIVGDFNSEMTESSVEKFCRTYHLHNLIKDPTCFKNTDKSSFIDLLLTNFPNSLIKSQTLETGLLDFHKLTLTVLKTHYKKQKPLVETYRDYKTSQMKFCKQNF